MLRKTLLILSAGATLSTAAFWPNIALALPLHPLLPLGHVPLPLLGHGGPLPLGHGPLPLLGHGGAPLLGHGAAPSFFGHDGPAGHPGLGGPVGQLGRGDAARFRGGDRGLQGHAARYGYGYGYGNSYGHSRYSSSYGYSGSRRRHLERYGDGQLYGSGGYASSDDGCYYANTYGSSGRYGRAAGCSDDE